MKTKVLEVKEATQVSSALAEAAGVLLAGGLVGFPTETVYGLAANAEQSAALERLARIKNRPPHKPFTLHIGERAVIDRYVPQLSLLNRFFLRKAWPGPLTVVFALTDAQIAEVRNRFGPERFTNLYFDNSIGIRYPDHPVAQQLLARVPAAVVAPSANRAEAAPPQNAQDVLDQLDGQIDLLLDAGPTRYRKASTIVKIEGDTMTFLREGVLDASMVQRMRSLTILFVCTGNSCRSPMAEGFARQLLAEKTGEPVDQLAQKGYKVVSAGVSAFDGAPASPEAVQVLREAGVDISGHRARMLTVDLINQADVIFAMGSRHYQAITAMAPQAAGKTSLLALDRDIEDPIGEPVEVYRQNAERIRHHLRLRLEELEK